MIEHNLVVDELDELVVDEVMIVVDVVLVDGGAIHELQSGSIEYVNHQHDN